MNIILILLQLDSLANTAPNINLPPPPASGSLKDYLTYLAVIATMTLVGGIWRTIEIKLLKKKWGVQGPDTQTDRDNGPTGNAKKG